jgi:hypothetical protein
VANAFISPFLNTQAMYIKSVYTQQHCLAGFEPGSFCYRDGCDVHCATPPGQQKVFSKLTSTLGHAKKFAPGDSFD